MPSDVPTAHPRARRTSSIGSPVSSVDELNKDMAGVRHCWASTGLLQAWERSVQVEAAGKLAQLFPNMFPKEQFDAADPRFNPFPASTAHDESGTEDEQAGYAGWCMYPSHRSVGRMTGGRSG